MGYLLMLNSHLMKATSQVRTCLIHFLKIGWKNSPHWCPAFCQHYNPSQSLNSTSEHSFSFRSTSSSDALLQTHHSYRLPYSIDHFLVTGPSSAHAGLATICPSLLQQACLSSSFSWIKFFFLFSTGWESVRSMSTYRIVS